MSAPHDERFDDLDWAMLTPAGVPATEAAARRRRVVGGHVADLARARYARRYYGRRWTRVEQARRLRAARRREAAQVEALARLLLTAPRPRTPAEARRMVLAALRA